MKRQTTILQIGFICLVAMFCPGGCAPVKNGLKPKENAGTQHFSTGNDTTKPMSSDPDISSIFTDKAQSTSDSSLPKKPIKKPGSDTTPQPSSNIIKQPTKTLENRSVKPKSKISTIIQNVYKSALHCVTKKVKCLKWPPPFKKK